MKKHYDEFNKLFKENKKYECIKYINSLNLSVIEIYEQILAPSLNYVGDLVSMEENDIFDEHIKTSIIRSIIESLYVKVYEERKETNNKLVLVLCPKDEYHELGARMVSDFFTILGLEVVYIGANTPNEEVLKAIEYFKPAITAISVTSYYNLFNLKDLITEIKEKSNTKILVGGRAFKEDSCKTKIGADYCLKTFNDIKKLVGEIC